MLFASNSIFVPNSTFAAENMITGTGFNVVNSEITDSTHSFTLVNSDNEIDIDIKNTVDGFIVNTVANDTETSTLIYNSSTGLFSNSYYVHLKFLFVPHNELILADNPFQSF